MTEPAGPGEARVLEVSTPVGPARAHRWSPSGEVAGRLVLGHGAGGGIGARDLSAVRVAAVAAGWEVALVEQPWRVAGRRVASPPPTLDVGWLAVLDALAAEWSTQRSSGRDGEGVPLVVGGRSAGARVACRTAERVGATAVCCLAFPLHPPGRPERSRAAEVAAPGPAGIPVLVVQGSRDPFGTPAELQALGLDGVRVVAVEGDHSLSRTLPVAAAVTERLAAWA